MLASFIAAAAVASAAPADLPGVWQGTVGDLPVRACFTRRESDVFGAYYYLSQLRLIPLETEQDAGNAFREGGDTDTATPHWRIVQADAGQLTAQWTNGRRTLPVRLSRLARMEGEESPCSSVLFHQPRLDGARTVTSRASKDGVDYTRIALDVGHRYEVTFETFALDGTSEAVQRINAELGRALTGNPPQWFECIQDSLGYNSFEGAFDESFAPAMILRRWLSVSHHWDGDCGGAHPDSSNAFRTFDLASGREIDLHDWLNPAGVEREHQEGGERDIVTLKPAVRSAILAGWTPEDPECAEVIRDEEFWNIGLSRGALVFSPDLAHVVQSCDEDFTVPIDRLRPFLTEEGAANLRALEAEPTPPAEAPPQG